MKNSNLLTIIQGRDIYIQPSIFVEGEQLEALKASAGELRAAAAELWQLQAE